MSVYDERPWLGRYADTPPDTIPEHVNALEMYRAGLEQDPDGTAVRYFDGELSRAELEVQSDALACALLAGGFARGRPAGRLSAERAAVRGLHGRDLEGRWRPRLDQPDEP